MLSTEQMSDLVDKYGYHVMNVDTLVLRQMNRFSGRFLRRKDFRERYIYTEICYSGNPSIILKRNTSLCINFRLTFAVLSQL